MGSLAKFVRRVLLGLCLISLAISANSAVLAVSQSSESRLDLAAIVLSPSDDGLDGYLHLGAFDESLPAEAGLIAAYHGFDRSPVELETLLTESGWQRKYVSRLGLPSPGNPSRNTRVVQSYVTEFRDAEGAIDAFAVLEDESNVSTAEDISPNATFGDEADLTLDEGIDSDNRQFRSLELTLRVGPHVGGVTLTVYPSAEGFEPDQTLVESLGETLLDRLQNPPEPGVGYSLARFDPGVVVTLDDAYYRLNGVDLLMAGESDESIELRSGSYADAANVYQLFQNVQSDSGRTALYSLTIYEFGDELAAGQWIDSAEDLIGANPYYADLEEAGGDVVGAEDVRAFVFAPGGGNANAAFLLARAGSTVHRVQIVPGRNMLEAPFEVLADLAKEQIDCSSSGSCTSVPVPESLLSYLDVDAGTPVAVDRG